MSPELKYALVGLALFGLLLLVGLLDYRRICRSAEAPEEASLFDPLPPGVDRLVAAALAEPSRAASTPPDEEGGG